MGTKRHRSWCGASAQRTLALRGNSSIEGMDQMRRRANSSVETPGAQQRGTRSHSRQGTSRMETSKRLSQAQPRGKRFLSAQGLLWRAALGQELPRPSQRDAHPLRRPQQAHPTRHAAELCSRRRIKLLSLHTPSAAFSNFATKPSEINTRPLPWIVSAAVDGGLAECLHTDGCSKEVFIDRHHLTDQERADFLAEVRQDDEDHRAGR
jgi:hypothetical protein